MELGSIITLIGIFVAIIAFISEKNRGYVVLKITSVDYVILAFLFLFIHYLLAFDWLSHNWFPKLHEFYFENGIYPEIWAYIITLLLIIYFVHIVFFRFFPAQHVDRVVSYYNKLLLNSDYQFLMNLIERFHKQDIVEYLKQVAKIKVQGDFEQDQIANFEVQFNKYINTTRLKYAAEVFGHIVNNG